MLAQGLFDAALIDPVSPVHDSRPAAEMRHHILNVQNIFSCNFI